MLFTQVTMLALAVLVATRPIRQEKDNLQVATAHATRSSPSQTHEDYTSQSEAQGVPALAMERRKCPHMLINSTMMNQKTTDNCNTDQQADLDALDAMGNDHWASSGRPWDDDPDGIFQFSGPFPDHHPGIADHQNIVVHEDATVLLHGPWFGGVPFLTADSFHSTTRS